MGGFNRLSYAVPVLPAPRTAPPNFLFGRRRSARPRQGARAEGHRSEELLGDAGVSRTHKKWFAWPKKTQEQLGVQLGLTVASQKGLFKLVHFWRPSSKCSPLRSRAQCELRAVALLRPTMRAPGFTLLGFGKVWVSLGGALPAQWPTPGGWRAG